MPDEQPGQTGSAPKEPETFSKEYVRELRHENGGYRLRAQESEKKAAEADERAKKAEADAKAKIDAAAKESQVRVIRAEVKAIAIKAGIVDIDGLKLADLSGVTLDDAGDVKGADEAIAALQKSKPYLFAKTTASTQQPPATKTPAKKSAVDMTDAEYREARRKYGLR